MALERLQKRIAASGLCSRRHAEELIVIGQVKVNGKVEKKLGMKVNDDDVIEVNGKPLAKKKPSITMAFYKPSGVLTSKSDPFHKETVMDLLPAKYRHLNPVGRLDKESEGLLLFTSDGALFNELTHASFGHKKTYQVLVKGVVNEKAIRALKKGGQVLDGYAVQPMDAKILGAESSATWLEIILHEGRKRQIRRIMEMLGYPVLKLIRTKIGELHLQPLHEGEWRLLNSEDLEKLKK